MLRMSSAARVASSVPADRSNTCSSTSGPSGAPMSIDVSIVRLPASAVTARPQVTSVRSGRLPATHSTIRASAVSATW
jgi:hypothetical protein